MLSTVQHKNGMNAPYKPTHANHPCTRWAGETKENYTWLWEHGVALCEEYTHRYGKTHKCQALFFDAFCTVPNLPSKGLTPFAQAMPEQYRNTDAVTAYRAFYCNDKARFASWERSTTPTWFTNEHST